MKAVTWQGREKVQVDEVADPEDRGADRRDHQGHLERPLRLGPAPLRGARACSSIPATCSATSRWASSRRSARRSTEISKGDRVVIPFNISCGHCWMCDQQLFAQCETTQNRDTGTGASLFGYTKLYGQVPGGQAEYLRVPQAHFGPIKVPGRRARRPLPVPLRRPADGMAGGRVRRDPRRRLGCDLRARPDRPDGRPDRQAQGRPRDRRRPGARAAGAGPRLRDRGARRLRRGRRHRGHRRARCAS